MIEAISRKLRTFAHLEFLSEKRFFLRIDAEVLCFGLKLKKDACW